MAAAACSSPSPSCKIWRARPLRIILLAHLFSLALALGSAPPESSQDPSDAASESSEDSSATPSEGEASDGTAAEADTQPEFGEIEAAPEPQADPLDSASGGYGAVAPLPTYTEELDRDPAGPPEVAPAPAPEPKQETGFQEPEDYGPFFEPEPVSEVEFPGDAHRPDRNKPFASVGGGTFCFVEDSSCGASLILDADVGVGLNIITTDRGFDVPYAQLRVRGGLAVRPIPLAKKRWHAWGVGVVANWSIASSSIAVTNPDPEDPNVGVVETDSIQTYRFGLLNQLWLSQKRNALHLDFVLGAGNSSVLDFPGRYWGTTAEVGLGMGGWGGIYFGGDFFDGDTRVVLGLRGHGIATGPMIALVLLGLVAGGVSL